MCPYIVKLDVIDEVRKILSNLPDVKFFEIINGELPVFIILGSQSSGKSSVIGRITNNMIKLPQKAEMCTRVSTEVRLRKGEHFQEVSLHGPNDTKPIIINEDDICKAVAIAQEKALENLDEDEIFASKYTIVIKFCGPNQPNVTFIDMPGFNAKRKADEQAFQLAEKRVNKYPGTLVVHVVKGDMDFDSVLSQTLIRITDKPTLTVKLSKQIIIIFFTTHLLNN